MELRDRHAANEARKGVKLVKPRAPELGDLWFGDGDAAEEGESDDDKGVDKDGDEAAGREGGDPWFEFSMSNAMVCSGSSGLTFDPKSH